jgi:hypothetical protein
MDPSTGSRIDLRLLKTAEFIVAFRAEAFLAPGCLLGAGLILWKARVGCGGCYRFFGAAGAGFFTLMSAGSLAFWASAGRASRWVMVAET